MLTKDKSNFSSCKYFVSSQNKRGQCNAVSKEFWFYLLKKKCISTVEMEELLPRVLSLLLLISFANGLASPPACSNEGIECEYHENNLIDSVTQVYSDEECRQICEDQLDCDYITYFNASAKPFSNFCSLSVCLSFYEKQK